jgi:hypothetical protein
MVFHLVNQIRMTNVSFIYIISFDSDHSIEIYSIRVITKLPNSKEFEILSHETNRRKKGPSKMGDVLRYS